MKLGLKNVHKLVTRKKRSKLSGARSMRHGQKVRSMLVRRGLCERFDLWKQGRLDKSLVPWWFCRMTMFSQIALEDSLGLHPSGHKPKEEINVHLEDGAYEVPDEMKRTETYSFNG